MSTLTPRVIWKLRGCLGHRTCAILTVAPWRPLAQGGDDPLHVLEGDADRGAVGTHLHAGRALCPAEAQVALGGQLHGLPVGTLLLHLDHRDVPPWAAVGAVAAADAGAGVDLHLQGPHSPGD